MSIIQLIATLERIRAQVGNVRIEVRNAAGDHDEAAKVQVVDLSKERGPTIHRVYIET